MTKRQILALLSVLILIAVGGFFVFGPKPNPQTEAPKEGEEKETKDGSQGDGSSESEITKDEATLEAEKKTETKKEQPSKKEVRPTITMVEQSQGNNELVVRAIVNGADTGSCFLSVERSGYPKIEREAGLSLGPTYYACNGFNVERSLFPVGGTWTVRVRIVSDAAEGTSDPVNINIQ